MKYNFKLLEDVGQQNNNFSEDDEKIFYDTETKTFYEPVENEWVPIRGARAIQLKQEYKKQKYLERHPEKKDKDLEKEEAERIARIKSRWEDKTEMGNKMRDEAGEVKKKKQKEIDLRAKSLEVQQQSDWDSLKVAPTAQEIFKEIQKDLTDNILDNDDTYWDFEKTYNHPNSFTVDPSIILQDDTYEEQPPEDEDRPKPYIYFFYDRSYSFNPGKEIRPGQYQNQEAWFKTVIGKQIEDALKKSMNDGEVLFKTYYFASSVHETEESALDQGGNDGDRLVGFIANLTSDYPSNVVIVTDSDSSTSYADIKIDGGVWVIFCNTIAPSLPKAFKSTKGVVKTFFIEDVESAAGANKNN